MTRRTASSTISSPAPSEGSRVNWLNIFYAIEWAVFAGFAFYLWYRLARDAWEKEVEELEDAASPAGPTARSHVLALRRCDAPGRARPGARAYSRAVTKSVSILILGAGGDLTKRLLLPGLASLLSEHDYDVQVLGAAREERTDDEWRQLIRDSFGQITDPADADRYLESARYIVTPDVTDVGGLRDLIAACDHTPIIYFALPPAVTAAVCSSLRQVDLPEGTRLALEKPFGTDLNSARALNRLLAQLVPEEQVFRIDHFLGMSMVLNILGLRFANQLFESVWNGRRIERVEIVYDELIGLEGRGGLLRPRRRPEGHAAEPPARGARARRHGAAARAQRGRAPLQRRTGAARHARLG